jgi:hypothetical protein
MVAERRRWKAEYTAAQLAISGAPRVATLRQLMIKPHDKGRGTRRGQLSHGRGDGRIPQYLRAVCAAADRRASELFTRSDGTCGWPCATSTPATNATAPSPMARTPLSETAHLVTRHSVSDRHDGHAGGTKHQQPRAKRPQPTDNTHTPAAVVRLLRPRWSTDPARRVLRRPVAADTTAVCPRSILLKPTHQAPGDIRWGHAGFGDQPGSLGNCERQIPYRGG